MDNKRERLYINKMFELKCEDGKYKMILCNALMSGDLEIDIDYKEYNRLLNVYRYFLVDEKSDVKVFRQDYRDKSNALFYFRKMFANEFAYYYE